MVVNPLGHVCDIMKLIKSQKTQPLLIYNYESIVQSIK